MNIKALIAEFIGTLALIFVGVGAIAANHLSGGSAGLTGIALAHGLTIAVMASATAAISGGHLNPAVTIGLLCAGKIELPAALAYVVAQCLGAVLGALLIMNAVPAEALAAVGFGTPALGQGISASQGLLMEIVTTFFLVFVVYGTAVDKRAPKMGALFIGLTVTLDIFVGGPISGAAMNPARHLGPALVGGSMAQAWIYWVGPVIGAVLAALTYRHALEK